WPSRSPHFNRCIERNEGYCEIGGMRRNTVVARTQHSVPAVFPADGGAAGAWRALVARGVSDITKVRATRALEEIAAHRRLVTHLRTRRIQQRLRDKWKLLDHRRVRSHICHRCERAQPEALRSNFDSIVEKACEAHQPLGFAYIFLQLNH